MFCLRGDCGENILMLIDFSVAAGQLRPASPRFLNATLLSYNPCLAYRLH